MELLPSTAKDWVEAIIICTLGGLTIWQNFFTGLKGVRKEQNADNDRLISLLKETVNQLEIKVGNLDEQYTATKKEVEKLSNENAIMKQLLQGRDQATIDFQKAAMESMKKIDALIENTGQANSDIRNLSTLIQKHLSALEL